MDKQIERRAYSDESGGFRCYHIQGIDKCFNSKEEAQRYLNDPHPNTNHSTGQGEAVL